MNKLLLDCVRFGFTPIKPNFVALTSLHYNASSRTKTPFTYTPNPPKSCIQTCNRTAPAVLPRHGLTAEYFSWSKPKETTKTGLPTISKWQTGLFLWHKPARREPECSAASAKRAEISHQRVPRGAAPGDSLVTFSSGRKSPGVEGRSAPA